MKPRYLHVSLGGRMGPPREDRSRGGGLNASWDLEKWKMSVFPCSTMRPHFVSNDMIILQQQKWLALECEIDLFWEMKSPLSIKEIMEMGIFRIFKWFSKERKTGDK